MWLIIEIYFARKQERALSSSGWQWGLGGEQARGAEPAFPRKAAGTGRTPSSENWELQWGCCALEGGEGTGDTLGVTVTASSRQNTPWHTE